MNASQTMAGRQFIAGRRVASGEATLLSLRAVDGEATGHRFYPASREEAAQAAEAHATARGWAVSIAIAAPHATAQGIRQWVVPVDKKRKAALFCHLYKQKGWDQVLVFVKTRKGVDELVETLTAKGIAAELIKIQEGHAG